MIDKVIYDCDGVLLDWVAGFRCFLKDLDGIETDPAGPCSYNLMKWIGTDDRDFIVNRINRFNSGERDFFANLSPVEGAVEVVGALHRAGIQRSVLTACNTDEATVKGRRANLEAVFGDFHEITCVDLKESKRHHLMKSDRSWFIEDNLSNAELGASIGHKALLLEYPHNLPVDDGENFSRVKNWNEIALMIGQSSNDLNFDIRDF